MPKGHVKTKLGTPEVADEPTMSDAALLVTVEELINRAMGPPDANIVDFKLVQLILEILARQQRILLQKIEIRITELDDSSQKSLFKSPPRTKSFGAVKHERKSPQREKRKDLDKKASAENVDENVDLKIQVDKGQKSKEETDRIEQEKAEKEVQKQKEILEEEGKRQKEKETLVKEEMKVKQEQDEFQKMSPIEQNILLKEEHEEIDEYEMVEKMSQREQIALEKTSRKESLGKEVTEEAEHVKDKIISKTRQEVLEKEPHEKINKISHEDKKEKQKQEEDKILNIEETTEIKEQIRTEKIWKKEKEEIKLEEQIETEKKQVKEYQGKENIPAPVKGKAVPRKISDASRIEITEKQIDKEKILVIEKGPSTRSESRSPSAIDFVTSSQLAFLEAAVEELRSMVPPKSLQPPGNEKLFSDMLKGTVSLPEAMETLQVEEKMKSAEESMTRIVEILTQLVSAGALPENIAVQVETLMPPSYEEEVQSPPLIGKRSIISIDSKATQSLATKSKPTQPQAIKPQPTQSQATKGLESRPSVAPEPSAAPSMMTRGLTDSRSFMGSSIKVPCVTHKDMTAYLKNLKDDITKILNRIMCKITELTENAQHINNAVADKVDVAQRLESRILTLYTLLADYDNQFRGFDSILSTQLQNIESQIAQMNQILRSGLSKMADANNIAEATAIMNLLEHSEEMETELSTMFHEIKGLVITQTEHRAQMQNLMNCMKMMQEEKADRNEVLEGLKYKADSSALAGMLSQVGFSAANEDFKRRIDRCHETFERSIASWAAVIKNLKNTKQKKADLLELLTTRDSVQHQLQALNNKIRIVAAVLGDPQIALNMRNLAVGAICGSCHEPARMEPVDATSGVPPRLPPLRQVPIAAPKEPCISEWVRARSPETRHISCRRWCGGSHTMVTDPTKRFELHVQMQAIPAKQFTDYGDDGRLYMCEEALQPCIECNSLGGEKTQDPVRGLSGRNIAEMPMSHVESGSPAKCSCPLIK